jgi:hypothetical protein
MVDRARKKKRPEQQPRPDCSVAQLTLGTPLSLLAALHERPEKIRYAGASVGPGPDQCNSRAKIHVTRIIGHLSGTFQRCANRELLRPAGLGNSTRYRPIVEFNEDQRLHRAAVMVCRSQLTRIFDLSWCDAMVRCTMTVRHVESGDSATVTAHHPGR